MNFESLGKFFTQIVVLFGFCVVSFWLSRIVSPFVFAIYPRQCFEFDCVLDFILYMFVWVVMTLYFGIKFAGKVVK